MIVIKDRVYIPTKYWYALSKSDRDNIKGILSKIIINPFNCPLALSGNMHTCKKFTSGGRAVCWKCISSKREIKIWFLTGKYFIFEKGDIDLVNLITEKYFPTLKIVNKSSFPKLRRDMLYNVDYSKLKEPRKSAQLKIIDKWIKIKTGQIVCPPRFGKCVKANTLIFTDKGIVPIKDLFPNNKDEFEGKKKVGICTRSGKLITSHLFKKKSSTTIRVRTNYGYEIEGTPEHPVQVVLPDLTLDWLRLDQVTKNTIICINKNESVWSDTDFSITNYILPGTINFINGRFHEDIKYPKRMNTDLARLLGYLVANGGLNNANLSIHFTSGNDLVIADFKRIINTFGLIVNSEGIEHSVRSIQLVMFLKGLGLKMVLSGTKDIPKSIMVSTKPIMTEFLSAYFSCDSTVRSNIELCTASYKLGKQLQIVLNNYGIICKRLSKVAYAVNSNTPHSKTYTRIFIFSKYREIFLSTFSLLKETNFKRDFNKNWGDTIPYVKEYMVNLKSKYEVSLNGYYNINGNNVKLGLFTDKSYLSGIKVIRETNLKSINYCSFNKFDSNFENKVKRLNHFFLDSVEDIKENNVESMVYDLTVPKTHNFIANGIVSHNTVLGMILSARSKTRVCIVIHQKELLDQFYNTFIKFTDIESKGKLLGKNLIKINPRVDEVDDMSVCLFTWQHFISKSGHQRLLDIKDKFGLLIADEAHRTASDLYSKKISRFSAKYRCGVTATPERKDELHFISNGIFGKPTVIGDDEQLPISYSINNTNWNLPTYKSWNNKTFQYLWNGLAKDENRNSEIVKLLKLDVKNGFKVLIPVKRTAHARNIFDLLPTNLKRKAVIFTGEVKNRDEIVIDIRKGKYDIVLATKQLISEGFDCPPMSCMYLNAGGYHNDPNALYQESARIRTQYENKNNPYIRILNDNGNMSTKSVSFIKSEFRKRDFEEIKVKVNTKRYKL